MASLTTLCSDAVPPVAVAPVAVAWSVSVPDSPAAAAAEAQPELAEVTARGTKRCWISAIRDCAAVTPSTAPHLAVPISQPFERLGPLRRRRPLGADQLGLLGRGGGQGALGGGILGGHPQQGHRGQKAARRRRGGRAGPGEGGLPLRGAPVGLRRGVRRFGGSLGGCPFLGAAQLQDRLQPEGGALAHQAPAWPVTMRCSHAHASSGAVESPTGCWRNASSAGARARARSTSGSLPAW